jgi:transcriptional regulator with XRE-family HTH domain
VSVSTQIRLQQEAFRLVRKVMGLDSDAALAEKLNVSRTTVFRNLTAKGASLSPEFITKLLNAFDQLDFDDLFERVDEEDAA